MSFKRKGPSVRPSFTSYVAAGISAAAAASDDDSSSSPASSSPSSRSESSGASQSSSSSSSSLVGVREEGDHDGSSYLEEEVIVDEDGFIVEEEEIFEELRAADAEGEEIIVEEIIVDDDSSYNKDDVSSSASSSLIGRRSQTTSRSNIASSEGKSTTMFSPLTPEESSTFQPPPTLPLDASISQIPFSSQEEENNDLSVIAMNFQQAASLHESMKDGDLTNFDAFLSPQTHKKKVIPKKKDIASRNIQALISPIPSAGKNNISLDGAGSAMNIEIPERAQTPSEQEQSTSSKIQTPTLSIRDTPPPPESPTPDQQQKPMQPHVARKILSSTTFLSPQTHKKKKTVTMQEQRLAKGSAGLASFISPFRRKKKSLSSSQSLPPTTALTESIQENEPLDSSTSIFLSPFSKKKKTVVVRKNQASSATASTQSQQQTARIGGAASLPSSPKAQSSSHKSGKPRLASRSSSSSIARSVLQKVDDSIRDADDDELSILLATPKPVAKPSVTSSMRQQVALPSPTQDAVEEDEESLNHMEEESSVSLSRNDAINEDSERSEQSDFYDSTRSFGVTATLEALQANLKAHKQVISTDISEDTKVEDGPESNKTISSIRAKKKQIEQMLTDQNQKMAGYDSDDRNIFDPEDAVETELDRLKKLLAKKQEEYISVMEDELKARQEMNKLAEQSSSGDASNVEENPLFVSLTKALQENLQQSQVKARTLEENLRESRLELEALRNSELFLDRRVRAGIQELNEAQDSLAEYVKMEQRIDKIESERPGMEQELAEETKKGDRLQAEVDVLQVSNLRNELSSTRANILDTKKRIDATLKLIPKMRKPDPNFNFDKMKAELQERQELLDEQNDILAWKESILEQRTQELQQAKNRARDLEKLHERLQKQCTCPVTHPHPYDHARESQQVYYNEQGLPYYRDRQGKAYYYDEHGQIQPYDVIDSKPVTGEN